jgi:Ser-tRNA(Ala) deacylase AlaX
MPRLNLSEADSMKMGKLIADAWRYPAIRKKLLENPEKAMTESEISIPSVEQIRIVAIEDTPSTVHLVLPVQPDSVTGDLLEEDSFLQELGTKIFAGCR